MLKPTKSQASKDKLVTQPPEIVKGLTQNSFVLHEWAAKSFPGIHTKFSRFCVAPSFVDKSSIDLLLVLY